MNLVCIGDSKRYYVNYQDLIFWIKSCYYQLSLSNQLYLSGSRKIFGGDIERLPELFVVEVELNIASGE